MGRRFYLLYWSGWTISAIVYSFLVLAQKPISVADVVVSSATDVAVASLLGLVVLRVPRWVRWEHGSRLVFWAAQIIGALCYSLLWGGFIAGTIYLFAPAASFVSYMRFAFGWQLFLGVAVYGLVAGIGYGIQTTARMREEQALAARAEVLRARAELRALRAQLNPHFLFNTLHSITALVRSDPDAVEDALERFGALLRYVLDANREQRDEVALGDELDFVRKYLALERLRFGERLRVTEEIDPDALDCTVLAFTLQPLVENAVRHGITPRAAGGTVRLAARLERDRLVLEVADDGEGTDQARAMAVQGVGLHAVADRLRARYGAAARMDIVTAPGNGFLARIELPAEALPLTTGSHAAPRPAARATSPVA
jgi:two-component system, LytTR family, sensor kinase